MTSTELPPLTGAKLILAAIVLSLGNFMVVLDTTITNVAMPTISGYLGVSTTEGTWIITAYAVAEAITVPLSGWLVRRFGQVRIFTLSVASFVLFSVLCGLSWSSSEFSRDWRVGRLFLCHRRYRYRFSRKTKPILRYPCGG